MEEKNYSINNSLITIFGATGKTGRELLNFFSDANINCQAVTRDLKKANPQPFVHWVEGDLADRSRPHQILAGRKRMYLVVTGNDIVNLGKNAIGSAKESGVDHIVYLSTNLAEPDSKIPIGKNHAVIEATLRDSGINWTILRPVGFMQNWLSLGDFRDNIKKERKIYPAIGNTEVSFIDARDIAEVAFTILTNPEPHSGKNYVLTCGKSYTYNDVAEIIGNAIGEKVTCVMETPEEARHRFEEKGAPRYYIDLYLMLAKVQIERRPVISKDVEEILGKPSRTVEEFIKEYAENFK